MTWSALRTICATNLPLAGTAASKDIAWPRHFKNCSRKFDSYRKCRWQAKHYSVAPLHLGPQRRYFFSIFRGADEEDGTTKETRKQTQSQNANQSDNDITNIISSIDTNDNIDANREWEEQYRRPITRELWTEFQNEGERTRNYLSSPSPPSQQYPEPSLSSDYKNLLSELQTQIDETWNGPGALEPPPEFGPTGKWTYKFSFSANGSSRVYERSTSSGMTPPETVLELPFDMEAFAMSLTPDEACVASLLQPTEGDPLNPWIAIRSVESGKESSLIGVEWLGGIVKVPSEVVGLEWGPIRTRGKAASNGPDFVYSLYLLLADHQGRPDRVALCHIHPTTLQVLTPPTVIYSSDDPAVMVDVQRTKGCSYVAIRALSKTSSEVFLSQGDAKVLLVRPRQDGVLYHLDVGKEGDIVLLTSDERHDNGGDYIVEEAFVSELPMSTTSATTMPQPPSFDDQDFLVEDMDLFQSHLVLYERSRKSGEQRIRLRQRGCRDGDSISKDTILDLSSSSVNDNSSDRGNIALPRHWSKLSPVGNMCFESKFFRFELESPISPGLVYEYDFDTQQLTMISRRMDDNDDLIAPQQPQYTTTRSIQKERILVESSDGSKVPLTLFTTENGDERQITSHTKTIVLVGYGAYGESMDLGYNPGWKSLLDRGVGIAFAHTRGGGDLGRAWYANGRREHKIKGIEDYETCAFYLRERFERTSKKDGESLSLVAKAFSAGGVLVGAAVNRNPGLFDKVILTNAFVDLASTMDRPNLFLTKHEYDEFGNPSTDSAAKARIRSYCPVYNLRPTVQCQNTSTRFLITGTLDDPNVPYWNATLYFRKLLKGLEKTQVVDENSSANHSNECQNDRVFLELQTSGGHHFSGSNRIEVVALENAFILKHYKE